MTEPVELSERELEILRLVATGASNKEIAVKLSISPNTVKVHLRNIFAKIGAVSRTEATVTAMRLGLVQSVGTPPEPVAVPSQQLEAQPSQLPSRRNLILMGSLLVLLLLAALLWLPGGWLNPRQVLPSATPATRWQKAAAPPEALSNPAGAVYNGNLYLIGGTNAADLSPHTWLLQRGKSRWQPLADKPTPVMLASAALLGEKIYLPGGCDGQQQPLAILEIFDPRLDTWTDGAPMPAARCAYALAALDGKLYLFGGWDGQHEVADTYIYDPEANSWEVGFPLSQPRQLASAVVINAGIAVLGGWQAGTPLDLHEVYYPNRNNSAADPWESRAAIPQARYAASAAVLADQLYLVGGLGLDEKAWSDAWQYLPADDRWVALEPPAQVVGGGSLLLPLGAELHLISAASHLTYQAIYTVLVPLIP
jgi:DNA-binding CsgD family transcriptional regulator/N-acetylneuraminic acid mutarotase